MKELTINQVIKKFGEFFSQYDYDESKILEQFRQYQLLKPTASVNDFAWNMFNRLMEENARKNKDNLYKLLYQQYLILCEMWLFRKLEKNTGNDVLQDMTKVEIERGLLSPYPIYLQISSGHCCEYCDSLNGKNYSVEDYMKEQPVGSIHCSRKSGCNCRVLIIPDR